MTFVLIKKEIRTHGRGNDHAGTQGDGAPLQTKERGLGRSQTRRNLDLELLDSRTVRKYISLV